MNAARFAKAVHTTGRPAVAISLCVIMTACEENPAGPEVSETEIWRLELEQTDDGSTALFPRRGTINLRMRLNHTATPDPACAGRTNPNATTFLATVEAIPSRLQPPATGTASGTWNCFGFSAEVRLTGGSTYGLSSDNFMFAPRVPIRLTDSMLSHRWAADLRRGHFLFAPDDQFEYGPFDSHLDVRVQNRDDRDAEVTLGQIGESASWNHRGLEYPFYNFNFEDSRQPERAELVPAGESRTLVWPAHPAIRSASGAPVPVPYLIWVTSTRRARPLSYGLYCWLGPERQNELVFIIHGETEWECSSGWLGTLAFFRVTPARLFLQPGASDTLMIDAYDVESLSAESSHAGVVATVASYSREAGTVLGEGNVVVTVAQSAPRMEHGVIVRGRHAYAADLLQSVSVEVYELRVTAAPDTVTVVRGESGSATIRLARTGLLGLDVRMAVPNLPEEVLLVPPEFNPGITTGDSSRLTLRIHETAQPGTYPLTVCAVIVADPRETCHPARVTLRVTTPPTSPTGSISGLVTANGGAIAGATLTLSGGVSATTTTGDGGFYSFTDLAAATYTITISVPFFPGITFEVPSRTVTLAPGEALIVNFSGTY